MDWVLKAPLNVDIQRLQYNFTINICSFKIFKEEPERILEPLHSRIFIGSQDLEGKNEKYLSLKISSSINEVKNKRHPLRNRD